MLQHLSFSHKEPLSSLVEKLQDLMELDLAVQPRNLSLKLNELDLLL